MNIEELELSLKTEFESYFKNTLADIKREVFDFQKKIEAEFEKHKSQIDTAFDELLSRLANNKKLDKALYETITEHLRLARDEGARITAAAIAEAEEMERKKDAAAKASIQLYEIRNAIEEISSKTTQSAILKALVSHAAKFTPRGAFFIIKNEHFVGWRVFGKEANIDDRLVREVFFSLGNKTILRQAVNELKTVKGSYGDYSEDSIYLNKLQFNHPEQMYAIPLIVRERAVAVLYADNGIDGNQVCLEALETLVKVTGLTVEISASARSGKTQTDATSLSEVREIRKTETSQIIEEKVRPFDFERASFSSTEKKAIPEMSETISSDFQFSSSGEISATEKFNSFENSSEIFRSSVGKQSFSVTPGYESAQFVPVEETEVTNVSFSEVKSPFESSPETSQTFAQEPVWNQSSKEQNFYSPEPAVSFESTTYETFETPVFEAAEEISATPEDSSAMLTNEYGQGSNQIFDASQIKSERSISSEAPSFDTTVFEANEISVTNGKLYETVVTEINKPEISETKPVQPVIKSDDKPLTKSRLSERNVDLPIEVSEDERRLHNDARRFARLLVSEIKLYNEQKVKEGREANDLYDRLREAIDRSREMYDKRVHPPVANKFDYFHYELVSNLAEGDPNKLGPSYPGPSV